MHSPLSFHESRKEIITMVVSSEMLGHLRTQRAVLCRGDDPEICLCVPRTWLAGGDEQTRFIYNR